MAIRVLIADDHKILREGLQALLQKLPDMEVVGEADDGRAIVGLVKKLVPNIVLMDVAMPDLNGIEATRQILVETTGVKVLALSMHTDRRFIAQMLHAGAAGYILKDCAFEELAVAIQTVVANRIYLSPRVSDVVIDSFIHRLPLTESADAPVLTPREREVLQLLAEGRTTKMIADMLHISVKTVETHRKQIMDRLNLRSLPELTKYAIRQGLTSLER